MDPEGISLTKNSFTVFQQNPPSFDGYDVYQKYGENLLLWNAMTSVSSEKRAPTAIEQLTGQAHVTANTLSLEVLAPESGINRLLGKMDRKFGMDEAALLDNNVSSFFDYLCTRNMSVDEILLNFMRAQITSPSWT